MDVEDNLQQQDPVMETKSEVDRSSKDDREASGLDPNSIP